MSAPVVGMRAPLAPVVQRVLRPFQEFVHAKSSGGIVLLAATAVALVWANSAAAESYHHLWEIPFSVGLPGATLTLPLHMWINDGLMAIFFFLVGLEIKREVLVGELSSIRSATLPLAAALGGMVVPALIYLAFNAGTPAARGWGIPMATDIAFALGILALLGPRVPVGLKVFLAALAIADDLGAVLVIAIFYTSELNVAALGYAAVIFGGLALCNLSDVRRPWVYTVLGAALWLAVFHSGVHATVAGVLLAMAIPARTRIDCGEFLVRARHALAEFESGGLSDTVLTNQRHQEALQALEESAEEVQAPLLRFENRLHVPVAFLIIPLFALANAGVHLTGGLGETLASPIALGVLLGLLFGKPIGIALFSWLVVKARVAELPGGVRWPALLAVSWLGGIGFTMSLFIGGLAFGSDARLDAAKVGILGASVLASAVGGVLVRAAIARGGQVATDPVEATNPL